MVCLRPAHPTFSVRPHLPWGPVRTLDAAARQANNCGGEFSQWFRCTDVFSLPRDTDLSGCSDTYDYGLCRRARSRWDRELSERYPDPLCRRRLQRVLCNRHGASVPYVLALAGPSGCEVATRGDAGVLTRTR